MINRVALALFALLAVTPVAGEPAKTATATKPRTPAALPGTPMKVLLIRSAAPGCEPTCSEWIAAQGMIDAETLPQFRKILKALGSRKPPILVDSGGGMVDESLEIGRLIRAKGLEVAVAKTILRPCHEGDAVCRKSKSFGAVPGLPMGRLAKCASSCAFLLAAGTRRYVGLTSFVGVHQVTTYQTTAQILQKYRIEKRLEWGVPMETRRTLISEKRVNEKTVVTKTPESTYRRVSSYFAEMGIAGGELMPILKTTPSTSIHWLTRAELNSTAMATDAIDGEQLIAGVPMPGSASIPAAASTPAPPAGGAQPAGTAIRPVPIDAPQAVTSRVVPPKPK